MKSTAESVHCVTLTSLQQCVMGKLDDDGDEEEEDDDDELKI